MSFGLLLVTTNTMRAPEIINDRFNGYLCEPENPLSLARALIKAKETNWDNKSIESWVNENFSWDKCAKQLISEFNKYKDNSN
jgi:glycosyltransferase involved in cell wall biosynthesis